MFIAISLATLSSTILLEAAKYLGGKAASDFLYKRIKKKLKEKYKLKVNEEGISEKGLEQFREVLQEELQAFGIGKKEIDFMIMKSVQKLSDEHGMILNKMENIESLLIELTTGLLYDAHVSMSDVPIEVGEKLFERFLIGDKKAEEKIEEYIEDQHFSSYLKETMLRYKPIQEAYQYEELMAKRFLRHFKGDTKEEIDQLALFAEIWGLIGSKTLDANKVLEAIVIKLLKDVSESTEIELPNLLKFLHLLDLCDSLSKLDYDTKSQIIMFLKVNINDAPFYRRMEIAYFLMKFSVNEPEIMENVSEALSELAKQKYSDKFVEQTVSVNKRILRFFKKKANLDVERSMKVIRSLTRRFEKRKFSRETSLLEGQLTRVLVETDLLATQMMEQKIKIPITELREVVVALINTLIKAKDNDKLSAQLRFKIWQVIDNSIYILNRLAVKNTQEILKNWEIDLAKKYGFYSEDWGLYRRKSKDELEETVKKIKLNESFIKKIEIEKKLSAIEDLPEPPREEKVIRAEKTDT